MEFAIPEPEVRIEGTITDPVTGKVTPFCLTNLKAVQPEADASPKE